MPTRMTLKLVPTPRIDENTIDAEEKEELRQLDAAAEIARRVALRYRQELLRKYTTSAASSLIAAASSIM